MIRAARHFTSLACCLAGLIASFGEQRDAAIFCGICVLMFEVVIPDE